MTWKVAIIRVRVASSLVIVTERFLGYELREPRKVKLGDITVLILINVSYSNLLVILTELVIFTFECTYYITQ